MSDAKQAQSSFVKSADRAFDILEYVGDAAAPPSFSQMLEDLDIPRSSLFHLLNNLLARRYLERDPATDRYCIGENVAILAKKVAKLPLETIVTATLKQLTAELNETSGFYVRVGDTAEVIASTTSNQALTYAMFVGERAPLYAISGGKVVLAKSPDADLDSYLHRVEFTAITPRTIGSKRRLRDEIAAVRDSGFAYSHEEFTPGVTGIATAVDHEGRFFGALNLAVPTARFTEERRIVFCRRLKSAALSLAAAIAART